MKSFCGENAIGYMQKRSFTVDPRLAGTRHSHNAYTQLTLVNLDDQVTELCFARSVLCARVFSGAEVEPVDFRAPIFITTKAYQKKRRLFVTSPSVLQA